MFGILGLFERGSRMKNEECWVLLGKVRSTSKWRASRTKYSLGEPACVEYDWDWVLRREEAKGDILGFVHTHPFSCASPSITDYTAMKGLVMCFGRPMLCAIRGTDGLRAHWFFDDLGFSEGKIKQYGKTLFWGIMPDPPEVIDEEPDLVKSEILVPRGFCALEGEETFEEFNDIQKGKGYDYG